MRRPSARVERRVMLDALKKDEMLAVAIRNHDAFETVGDALTVERVQEISDGYGLVWKVVREFHAKFEELPTRNQIETEMLHQLANDPGLLTYEDKEEVDDFLEYAFDDALHGRNLARSKSHRKAAVETCQLFLQENSALRYQEVIQRDGRMAIDIPAMLEAHRDELAAADQLTTTRETALFPADWDQKAGLELHPTGITALDRLLSGGLAGGEVLAFLAPFGSCKTTVAVQAACKGAMLAAAGKCAIELRKHQRPVVFLISTEMVIDEFRIRALSYMTKIPRKRLAEAIAPGKGIKTLSDDPEPGATPETAYEKKAFRAQIEETDGFLPEQGRIRWAISVLEAHLKFFDCTEGNTDRPAAKDGGIKDIANWVKATCRKDKTIRPALFILDHASALALREVTAKTGGFDDLRQVLRQIPLDCGEMLAKIFKVGFVVLHQLSGEANNRNPAADLHHTDAAECKAFGEFADHVIVCGKPTEDGEQVAKWKMTKHRREPPKAHAFVKILGHVCRVIDVSNTFTVTEGNRAIVRKADLHKIEGTKARASGPTDLMEAMG